MNVPFVSVVVTTYNRKELLKRTIDSILSQTYNNFELIVVDNYSDYDFVEFIGSFESYKIKAYQNQNNGIIAVNRNYGIKHATGEFVAFCDDDDYWFRDKLEKCMDNSDDFDFICHDCIMTNGKIMKSGVFVNNNKPLSMMLTGNVIPLSSVVIRKSILDKCGDFDTSLSITMLEDWDLWMRCLSNDTRFRVISEGLGVYTVSPSNSSSNLIVIQKQYNFYHKYYYLLNGFDKWRGYSSLCYRIARRYHSLGYCFKALKYYLVSFWNFFSVSMTCKSLGGILLCLLNIRK